MKFTVDFYATFLVTVEVEAGNADEAKDKALMEDLDAAAARKIAMSNGLPELEYEPVDAAEQI
jgi:hypothetical protein